MNIYRIRITLPGGRKSRFMGLFSSTFEAVFEALAMYPAALSVAAICLHRGVA